MDPFRIILFLNSYGWVFSLRKQVVFNGLFGSVKVSSTPQVVKIGAEYNAAFLMAINEINNKKDGINDNLLPNTTIMFTTGATDDDMFFTTVAAAYVAWSRPMRTGYTSDLVIGPDGNNAFVNSAGYISSLYTPQIAFQSTSTVLLDKTNYVGVLRISHSQVMDALTWGLTNAISISKFNWKRIIVFSTSDNYGSQTMLFFNEFLSPQITILGTFVFSPVHVDFTSTIQAAKKLDGYIFLIVASGTATARLLEQGYNMGLFKEGTQILGGQYLFAQETFDAFSDKTKIPLVMKGALVVRPAFNYTSSTRGKDFVRRFRAQSSTYGWRGGKAFCSNKTDSFGYALFNPLLVTQKRVYYDKNVCTGVDFTKYRADGSNLNINTAFAYDATVAAARAVHHLIYVEKRNDFTYKDVVRALIHNVSFTGITGRISFSPGLGPDQSGRGERIFGLSYKIWNFQPDYYANNPNTTGFVPIYSYTLEWGIRPCDGVCYPPVFNTIDNSAPVDHAIQKEVLLGNALTYFVLSLAVLCTVFVIRLIWFVVTCRKKRILRTAQPMMLYMILFGAALACLKMWQSIPGADNNGICVLQQWYAHLAFGFGIGALVSKAWVVHKIFNSRLRKVRINPYDPVINTLLLVVIIVFFLFLITFIGNPKVVTHIHRPSLDDQPIEYVYCGADDTSINTILIVVEILILLVGVRISFLIWHVPDGVNESFQILADVVVIVVISIMEAIVRAYGNLNPLQIQVSTDISFGVATFLCLLILFEPKAYLIRHGYEFDHEMKLVRKGSTSSNRSPTTHRSANQNDIFNIVLMEDAVSRLRVYSPEENKKMAMNQIDLGKEKVELLRKHIADWTDLVNACTDKESIDRLIETKGLDNVYLNLN